MVVVRSNDTSNWRYRECYDACDAPLARFGADNVSSNAARHLRIRGGVSRSCYSITRVNSDRNCEVLV